MSNQTTQRVWRNVSPSTTKQGPIKAVKAFSLKQGKSKSTSSPSPRDVHKLWPHRASDHRQSPERKSPGGSHSPNHKDKTKASRLSPVPGKWRANSADTVVPSYLTGQWPKDITNLHHYQSDGVFMCDKSTQTVNEWALNTEKKKKVHRRSASFGQGDQLKLQYFKQHLQKSKGSKNGDSKQRSSPVQGNHSALSLTAPPALCSQQTKAILVSPGHVQRQNMNRYQRNSVEGLNMEIEKLVSSVKMVSVSSGDSDEPDSAFKLVIPDGHRAPAPDVSRLSGTRSVDTQTPSSVPEPGVGVQVTAQPRPASISPETLPRSGNLSAARLAMSRSGSESADSKSSKDAETSPELLQTSPNFNKSCPFVREPPDGCEKITVFDENRHPLIKEPMLFNPVKPNQFVFKPSQGSAFCPLIKSYLVDGEYSVEFTNPTTAALSAGIDG